MHICRHRNCELMGECVGRVQAKSDIENSLKYPDLYPMGLIKAKDFIFLMMEKYGCTNLEDLFEQINKIIEKKPGN